MVEHSVGVIIIHHPGHLRDTQFSERRRRRLNFHYHQERSFIRLSSVKNRLNLPHKVTFIVFPLLFDRNPIQGFSFRATAPPPAATSHECQSTQRPSVPTNGANRAGICLWYPNNVRRDSGLLTESTPVRQGSEWLLDNNYLHKLCPVL